MGRRGHSHPYFWLWLLCVTALALVGSPARASLREDYRQFIFQNRTLTNRNPRLEKRSNLGVALVERVRITTEAGQDAVVLIVRPRRQKPYPTALVQHFVGGSKDDALVLGLLSGFVARGYLAAAIDGRYRGERAQPLNLRQAIDRALTTGPGRPWLIDTVFDMLRTVDYLVTRPDVDPRCLVVTGVSEGGIEAWLAAVADDRFRVVVPALGVSRFQDMIDEASGPSREVFKRFFNDALLNFAHQLGETEVNERVIREAWARLLPGFTDRFEATRLVPLLAPRPLLVLNHEQDELIPLRGAQSVFDAARPSYQSARAVDRLRLRVAPFLGHAGIDPGELAALYAWFNRCLKNSREPR
jgi:dienelactone hydrolase